MTNRELEQLDANVKATGLSRESYIRMVVDNRVPSILPSEDVVDILHHLRKIGNNLNQIAYIANATNCINEEEYRNNFVLLQNEIDRIMILLVGPVEGSSNHGNN